MHHNWWPASSDAEAGKPLWAANNPGFECRRAGSPPLRGRIGTGFSRRQRLPDPKRTPRPERHGALGCQFSRRFCRHSIRGIIGPVPRCPTHALANEWQSCQSLRHPSCQADNRRGKFIPNIQHPTSNSQHPIITQACSAAMATGPAGRSDVAGLRRRHPSRSGRCWPG